MPLEIRAAVHRGPGSEPTLDTLTIDDPRPDEIRVAIRGVGICHTDMVMRDQHLPIPQPVVLGHEGAGVVEAVGSAVCDLSVGDHVVLSFDSCGHCPSCADAAPAYCHNWFPLNFAATRTDGSTALTAFDGSAVHSHIFGQSSFATHAIVHRRNAVKVDRDLPLELLGPLGCGIQTGAGTVLNALRPRSDSTLAVIGVGAVGLSAIMAANITGVKRIVAIDLNPDRVDLARELGATNGCIAGTTTMIEHAQSVGAPSGFDYIIDTSGVPSVIDDAIMALAPRGELALVGAYPPVNLHADLSHMMSGGRVIRGIVEGSADPQAFIPELIAHYRAGRFPFDRLIERFDFAQLGDAIRAGEEGRAVKPVAVIPH